MSANTRTENAAADRRSCFSSLCPHKQTRVLSDHTSFLRGHQAVERCENVGEGPISKEPAFLESDFLSKAPCFTM